MVFKKRKHSPHIRDDEVGLNGDRNLRGQVLEKLNFVGALIGSGDFPRDLNDFTRLNSINAARAELAGQNGHNSRSGADIHDHSSRTDRLSKGLGKRLDAKPIRNHVSVTAQAIHISRLPTWRSWNRGPQAASRPQRWLHRGGKFWMDRRSG